MPEMARQPIRPVFREREEIVGGTAGEYRGDGEDLIVPRQPRGEGGRRDRRERVKARGLGLTVREDETLLQIARQSRASRHGDISVYIQSNGFRAGGIIVRFALDA
jgi:hypothetical protein